MRAGCAQRGAGRNDSFHNSIVPAARHGSEHEVTKKPEDWLDVASPSQKTRGSFKLFLGYAPGVGKTYAMLSEAIRRHSRDEDVVIGVVETHGRKAIEELVTQLEVVPRKKIEYKGTLFEEMDLDGILARKPAVVLVDELAHTNIPGSKNRKRYEDVQALLAANLDVISTLNIQHIESISPVVRNITGVAIRETVPDWVPMTAKDIQKNWAVRERIAVCVSSNPAAQYLIARAARMARRLDSELYVIHVDTGRDGQEQDKKTVAANLRFAENLGAKVIELKAASVADAVANVVREKHITQVIFGRSVEHGWRKYLNLSAAHRFLRESPQVDVHIVTQEKD